VARVGGQLLSQLGDGEDMDADRSLALLKMQRLEIVRQRARGKVDDPTLDLLRGELDAQAVYLKERAEVERRLRDDIDAQRRVLEAAGVYLEQLAAQVADRLHTLDFAKRRELLLALVDRIWVDSDNHIGIDGAPGPAAPDGDYAANCSTALRRASM
jgi:hypothetical protein